MSPPLHCIIRHDGFTLCGRDGEADIHLPAAEEATLGKKLAEYFVTHGGGRREVLLFIAEDLLFYKTITLPLDTQDVDEAVSFQLGVLAPFPEEDLLYTCTSQRQKEHYRVVLACASRQVVEPVLREVAAADVHIAGLHPEFLRYLSRNAPKERWGLLLEGRLDRVLLFEGQRLVERILLPAHPQPVELPALCSTDRIYHPAPPEGSGLADAGPLVIQRRTIKEFNMLPAQYRRPEYSRFFIAALVVLNLLALVAFVGGREWQLRDLSRRVEAAITEVAPRARQAMELRRQEQELMAVFEQFQALAGNPDIISFLTTLTKELPRTAYLDQMRLDGRSRAIYIQGYTDDIAELTAKLESLGDAKLKSTSRRRNKIYFNIEIALP